jgi:hypothetical protein
VVFELLVDRNSVTLVDKQWCLKDASKCKVEKMYFHGIPLERCYDVGQRGQHLVCDLYLQRISEPIVTRGIHPAIHPDFCHHRPAAPLSQLPPPPLLQHPPPSPAPPPTASTRARSCTSRRPQPEAAPDGAGAAPAGVVVVIPRCPKPTRPVPFVLVGKHEVQPALDYDWTLCAD